MSAVFWVSNFKIPTIGVPLKLCRLEAGIFEILFEIRFGKMKKWRKDVTANS
jgi:hypothetical protein